VALAFSMDSEYSCMKKYLILGAGVAGLSVGNSLLDLGVGVTLLEGGTEFSVKTCGEFLSYKVLPLLETWGISPDRRVSEAFFHHKEKQIAVEFPELCGSMPRLDLELQLADRFQKKGGTIHFGKRIDEIVPKTPFLVSSEDGDSYEADALIISAGRWQGKKAGGTVRYQGIKNHFCSKHLPSSLHMVLLDDGYCGVSSLNGEKAVISCLQKFRGGTSERTSLLSHFSSVDALRPFVSDAAPFFESHLEAPIGGFGIKELPNWPNAYFVGDAAATIAPIFGEGMTLALNGGKLAADYIVQGKWEEYRAAWKTAFEKRVRKSIVANTVALSPTLQPLLFSLWKQFPSFFHKRIFSTDS